MSYEDKISFIKSRIKESINVKIEFLEQSDKILEAANLVVDCFKKGNKILICGNGGSAADAQHIAGELVNKFLLERKGLPAISLASDSSVLTSWANDYNFEGGFERQVEALGKPDDILIGISTSGNSKNIIKAINKAKEKQMKIISLTGNNGGEIKPLSDININVNSDKVPRIQESHIVAYHIFCELIEKEMFSEINKEKEIDSGKIIL